MIMKLTVRNILLMIWKGLSLIVISAIVGAIIAGVVTFAFIKPEYTATAKMYVYNEKLDKNYISSGDLTVSKSLVDTHLIIIKSKPVLEEVTNRLSKTYENLTASDILDMLSGCAINETEAFYISASNADAQLTQDIVNTIVEVAPEEIIRVVKAASVEVIESAELPTKPYWPIKQNLIIGFILGTIASMVYIIIKTSKDYTVYGRNEITNSFKTPIIGNIPAYKDKLSTKGKRKGKKKANDLYISDVQKLLLNEKTPFSILEAYRTARTNIFYLPIEDHCKKIVITSADVAEGKTVTIINLAKLLSQAGKKVLLIDANMRKPYIAQYLNLLPESGLSEYLAGITPSVKIVRNSEIGFDVITSGKTSSSSSELLATVQMEMLLKEKETEYDYILIDTPPVNIITDSTMLAGKVNGYLFAVRAEYSNVENIKQAINSLDQVGASVLGMLLSNTDSKVEEYGRYCWYSKHATSTHNNKYYTNNVTKENESKAHDYSLV